MILRRLTHHLMSIFSRHTNAVERCILVATPGQAEEPI